MALDTTGVAIGVDVGGTKIAAGLVAADGSMLARTRADTPTDARQIEPLLTGIVRDIARDAGIPIPPVGVGAAGLVDPDGVIRYAPNIAWADYPLQRILTADLGVSVTVDNDANVAAWGEYTQGAGAHARTSMVMLTIGTGVGGGLVLGNTLIRGTSGMAAEFGHMTVSEGGEKCGCGHLGHLEAVASGRAIGRMAREGLASGEAGDDSPLREHHLESISGKHVTIAAHRGDPFAQRVLDRAGRWLGVGIAALVNALDPEIVVLGGGAMEAGDLLLEPAREAALAGILGRDHRFVPPIVRAQLADDAGVVGAALLALSPDPVSGAGRAGGA